MSYTSEGLSRIRAIDFERGVRDCKEGVPHRAGQGIMYNRGYNAQKQLNPTGEDQ